MVKIFKKDGTTIITVYPETDEEKHLIGTAELLSKKKNTPEPVYVQQTLFDNDKDMGAENKEQGQAPEKKDISDAFKSAWLAVEDEKNLPF